MDKGTSGATGYDLTEDFVEYRMNNPETLKWKIGMIHSHHHMRAYFSTVDMSELNDNTEFHNYYLSLVVNNHGALVAKVAFRGDIGGYQCKDEKGESWKLKLSKEKQVMFTFDCKISSPTILTKVPEDFAKRTEEIILEKERKQKVAENYHKKWEQKSLLPPHSNFKDNWKRNKRYTGVNPFLYQGIDDDVEETEQQMWNKSFERDPIKGKSEMTDEERTYDFVRYFIRLADESEVIMDTLEDALEDSEIIEDKQQYLSSLITMYPAIFEKYWDIFGEIDTESFYNITEDVLVVLTEYEGLFDVVGPLMGGLENMLTKLDLLNLKQEK